MLNQLHTLSRAVYYYASNFYTGTAAEANKLKRMMAYAMANGNFHLFYSWQFWQAI